jgi:hypothetical protein
LARCEQALATGEGVDIVQTADRHTAPSHQESHPTLLSEKDVVAPLSPATCPTPSRCRLRKRAMSAFLNVKEENERCTCCTKEDFWVCFDIFCAMDRRQAGAVRRGDFVWSLSAHGASVEFQRVVRRSRLSAYFKATAQEIGLEEYLHRIFPNVSEPDWQKMQRWVNLRKAHMVLSSATFGANDEELQAVFDLLSEDASSGTILLVDLLRAGIMSREEILAVIPESGGLNLSYQNFREIAWPVLVRKYASKETCCKYLGCGPTTDWEESMIHPLGASKLEEIRQVNALDEILISNEMQDDASEHSATAGTPTETLLLSARSLPVHMHGSNIAEEASAGTMVQAF